MTKWQRLTQQVQLFCQQHVYGFRFWHAVWVAIGIHVLALIAFVFWSEPEVVDVPFNPIHIKLGDVNFAAAPAGVVVPDVQVTIAKEAPAPTPAAPTAPVAPPVQQLHRKPAAPNDTVLDDVLEPLPDFVKEFEELIADAMEVVPDYELPLPEAEPEPTPEPQPTPAPTAPPAPAAPTAPAAQPAAPNAGQTGNTPLPQGEVGSTQGNRKKSGENKDLSYRQMLSLWVEKHKQYPEAARKAGIRGEAIIRLDIEKSGYITNYRLDKRTGYPILDDAVIAMIERANPVPPIPPTETARAFRIAIRFSID